MVRPLRVIPKLNQVNAHNQCKRKTNQLPQVTVIKTEESSLTLPLSKFIRTHIVGFCAREYRESSFMHFQSLSTSKQ